MAGTTDRFLSGLGALETAGSVFFDKLPNNEVADPQTIELLTDAYVSIRSLASEGPRLARAGSFSFPQGITWDIKARLANALGNLHLAMRRLN
jgi:hypothetical protein